jgi:hypothetical protein
MTRDPLRAERITMLTDFLLAVVAGILALLLLAGGVAGGRSALGLIWALTFFSTSAAAVAGGIFHGSRYRTGPDRSARLWRITLLLSAPIGFFLLAAAGLGSASPYLTVLVLAFAAAKLLVVVVFLIRKASFAIIAYDSGLSLLVLGLVVAWGVSGGGGFAGGGWILGGVVLSLVGAAAQRRGWRSDRYFDHNDVFHLAQAAACCLFFIGAGRG